MSERLAGKKALITGGAGGLGIAIARHFLREGAQVALTDVRAEAAGAVAAELGRGHEGRIRAFALDVTAEDAWVRVLPEAAAWMGGLSVLVHNAGVLVRGSVEQLDYADWQTAMHVNLDAVFLGTKHALRLLGESQPGSIVVVSSISALIASHDMPAYNVSKAGVWMLTKSIALHCARQRLDVRCNSVHPSFIDTPMLDGLRAEFGREAAEAKLRKQVPLGRLGTSDDVAHAVTYLASDESRFMTAAEIKLDGGISAM